MQPLFQFQTNKNGALVIPSPAMRNGGGFTLIEMLVVVAVIGILSSVVLTSLGPARDKAKDTRIVEEVNQLRSLAESLYDGDYDAVPSLQSGYDPTTIANQNIRDLAVSMKSQGGELIIQKSGSSGATTYLTYSKLNTKDATDPTNIKIKYYCTDSGGRSRMLIGNVPQTNASACPD